MEPGNPFVRDALVVAILRDPRERIWGRLLGLEGAGVTLHGMDLGSWDETLTLVRKGEGGQVVLSTRFVPMHRVEQVYLDAPSAGLPSLAEDFRGRGGLDPLAFLGGLP
jgi:hypothetical protein